MPTDSAITAKYLHGSQRARILRDRRDGLMLWRIARDTGLSVAVVRQVLLLNGASRIALENPREYRHG